MILQTQFHPRTPDCSELVWDSERHATATAGQITLPSGATTDWTPALLLATAAGASLLTTFVAFATEARLPLLGYVAQQRPVLEDEQDTVAMLRISPCITVSTSAAEEDARTLWTRATERAPVLAALKCPVIYEPRFVVLGEPTPVDQEC